MIRDEVSWSTDTLGDFVVLRSNGLPVYNFCVAVDDALMGITHVIRAEEHLPNTLRQVGLSLGLLGGTSDPEASGPDPVASGGWAWGVLGIGLGWGGVGGWWDQETWLAAGRPVGRPGHFV